MNFNCKLNSSKTRRFNFLKTHKYEPLFFTKLIGYYLLREQKNRAFECNKQTFTRFKQ